MKSLLILILIFSNSVLFATEELEKKLEQLSIPDGKVNPVVNKDKLYVVNTRYSSLLRRHEVSILSANNFTADSHLVSKSAGARYRFHINDKWGIGVTYKKYFNELSTAGETLYKQNALLPDTDFASSSYDLFVSYNTIYGKLRFSQNSVVYFDQYIALGAGKIDLAAGEQNKFNVDLGFSFWMGKHFSSRIGVNNEFYTQQQFSGERSVHGALGYIELGFLFGSGEQS